MLNKLIDFLKDTGERPVKNKFIEEMSDHINFAYYFATKHAKNKKILDFGCGGGYGTEYLSRLTTKQVIGYDIDKQIISANKNFFFKKNLSFSNKLPNDKYDLIICFQVIEHLNQKQRKEILNYFNSHLNKNGILLISTPNKLMTSYKLKKPIMVFHQKEFTQVTIKKQLKKYFHNIKILGQMVKSNTKNKINYQTSLNNISIRHKIIRLISQIEIVRIISRHLPMTIKSIFMGGVKGIKITFTLVKGKNVNNSFTLIAICQK